MYGAYPFSCTFTLIRNEPLLLLCLSVNGLISGEARLAKLKVDADFTAPCNTSILYPNDGGNMHCFTAVTQCAVLDVLGPPYNDAEGRYCAYYHEYPFTRFSGKKTIYTLCCQVFPRSLFVPFFIILYNADVSYELIYIRTLK